MAFLLEGATLTSGSRPTTPGLLDSPFAWDFGQTNDNSFEPQFWDTSASQNCIIPKALAWPDLPAICLEESLEITVPLSDSSLVAIEQTGAYFSTAATEFTDTLVMNGVFDHVASNVAGDGDISKQDKGGLREMAFTLVLPDSSIKKRRYDDMDGAYREKRIIDSNGNFAGTLGVFGNPKPTRQPYTEEKKQLTLNTRRLTACERCKKSKKRCDRPESPYECCKNCILRSKNSNPRILVMPCFLAQITDAQLFRDKPSPKHPTFSLRHQIYDSLGDIVRTQSNLNITLTQDFGEQLIVPVAEYLPQTSEKTYRIWKDQRGQQRRLYLPSFCIANMSEARENMLQYIAKFRSAFLRSLLMRSNQITAEVFDQALRFASFEPNSMVSMALDLCAAGRIIERDWRICGELNLGIDIVLDPESPWNGTVPITPMMDAQLDQIVIKGFLTPLRTKLLQNLERKMRNYRREEWFGIFLTVSILLSHTEWLLDHSHRNAIRCGSSTRYNYMPRAEGYFHACKTLLAHFHHVCQGVAPLSVDWNSTRASELATLDQEQIQFLLKLQERIRAKQSYMLSLRDQCKYESELYWMHQSFFPGWTPGNPNIQQI